jgi:hypothetical protein
MYSYHIHRLWAPYIQQPTSPQHELCRGTLPNPVQYAQGEEWKNLVKLFSEKYYVCINDDCPMISSTINKYAAPGGRLHHKNCIKCNKQINTKSFGLLPVWFCRYVRNELDYDAEEDNTVPRCQHVICGECACPTKKRDRKKIIFRDMNGN